ncbi:hypothetical protein, partial [Aeromonas salmonicida]
MQLQGAVNILRPRQGQQGRTQCQVRSGSQHAAQLQLIGLQLGRLLGFQLARQDKSSTRQCHLVGKQAASAVELSKRDSHVSLRHGSTVMGQVITCHGQGIAGLHPAVALKLFAVPGQLVHSQQSPPLGAMIAGKGNCVPLHLSCQCQLASIDGDGLATCQRPRLAHLFTLDVESVACTDSP